VASIRARLLRVALRLLVRRELKRERKDLCGYVAATRRAFERGAWRKLAPSDIRIVPVESDVRGEWLIRSDIERVERAILYLHGGGMVACQSSQFRTITTALTRRTGVAVFAVNYRHAPEHPYPAALEDALAAYGALRERIPADDIIIAGDSAGGNLALATVLALREREKTPRPVAGIIAISPWTDLTSSGASVVTNATCDDVLVAPSSRPISLAHAYADPATWRDPLVSPLFGDYAEGPPVLAFASASEMLLDDARALVARIRAQGGIATFIAGRGVPHDWPIYPIPEAGLAHRTMADFVARCFARSAHLLDSERNTILVR